MYYHARELKYVVYDKVGPAPISVIDEDFQKAYKWLGKYCGFFPQVWLSRSRSSITGYKTKRWPLGKNSKNDHIMFGFDIIKGFPLKYDVWELLLNPLMNGQDIEKWAKEWYDDVMKNENGQFCEYTTCIKDLVENGFDFFLKRHLFVEHDQIVVPSLNLKSAKNVFCRNEKEYKALTKMGFIKDRIRIQK